MLACRWEMEFMTRPSMRMKWGKSTTRIRIEAGLWECVARNNPCNQRFGCFDTRTNIQNPSKEKVPNRKPQFLFGTFF